MDSLSKFIGKKISALLKDGRILEGEAISFTDEIESDSGYEELSLDYGEYCEVFDSSEIEKITVIE